MGAQERPKRASRAEKVGWWLLPADPDTRVLARTIGALAGRLGVPTFPPHVTLASGPVERIDADLARASAERAFELEVERVETTAELARTLTLRFVGEERIAELARRLQPQARMEGRAPPHLSLVYAPLAADERAELAGATPPPLARIRFDAIAAVHMWSGELRLEDIPRWRVLARVPLAD